MASSPITLWQIEGEKVEAVTDLLFLGSKITVDGYYSHEIRRWLVLSRKALTNIDSVLKSRDITLPTKVYMSKLWSSQWSHMVIRTEPKEGRAPKDWCLQTVVLEKTPESPLYSKLIKLVDLKGNQPWVLIERTDGWSWSSSILVTWCEEPILWKNPWCWEIPRAKEGGVRQWDGWMASSIQWTWTWANSRRWWGTGRSDVLQSIGLQRMRSIWVTKQQQQTWNLIRFLI